MIYIMKLKQFWYTKYSFSKFEHIQLLMSLKPSIPFVTAIEAIQHIQSNSTVFLHGSAATPVRLINELVNQKGRLQNVEIISIKQKS